MNKELEKQRTLLRDSNKEEKRMKISRRDRFEAREIRQRIAESSVVELEGSKEIELPKIEE